LPSFSAVSCNTYIIFSTAQYFLRSLPKQRFRNISHLVVNDVHLHDPYTDLLLTEIRLALNSHPNLRIILLSQMDSTRMFTGFFGEGSEINMMMQPETGPRISYLNDLHSCIALAGIHKGPDIYKEIPETSGAESQRNEQMDFYTIDIQFFIFSSNKNEVCFVFSIFCTPFIHFSDALHNFV